MELEVSLLVDVVTLPGVLMLPAVVGVDIITWVVSVGISTVQVYVRTYVHVQSMSTNTVCIFYIHVQSMSTTHCVFYVP